LEKTDISILGKTLSLKNQCLPLVLINWLVVACTCKINTVF